jgi:hypothetical protein
MAKEVVVAVQHPRFNIETVPARQVEIPPTTRARYITGVYALNIEAPEGATGDWHDVFHWRDRLDMLFRSLTQYGRVYNLNGATVDWLDTPEQQHYLLEQATRMAPHLTEPAQATLTAWMEGELARA